MTENNTIGWSDPGTWGHMDNNLRVKMLWPRLKGVYCSEKSIAGQTAVLRNT